MDWESSEWLLFANSLVQLIPKVHSISHDDAKDPTSAHRYELLSDGKLWSSADLAEPPDRAEAGRRLYQVIIKVVTDDWQRFRPKPGERIPGADPVPRLSFYMWARCVAVHPMRRDDGGVASWLYATGKNSPDDKPVKIMEQYFDTAVGPSVMSDYVRQAGLRSEKMPTQVGVAAWLKNFCFAIWDDLGKIAEDLDVPLPDGPSDRLFRHLMPPRLAAAMASRLGELNPMQRWALEKIPDIITKKSSLLIVAPTGTGKSKIAQAILAHGAHDRYGTAVSVLPLKALVTQEADDWTALLDMARLSGWDVLPASRDYPENDSRIANGRFKIALAIYETIGAYLAAGARPLAHTRVLVIDEMQYLGDTGERGFKLEALLTLVRLIPEQYRPAVVGLSATVRLGPHDPLLRWLGIDADNISPRIERPVPMDAHVLATRPDKSGKYLDFFQPNAHLIGHPDAERQPFELRCHDYCRPADGASNSTLEQPERVAAMIVRDLLRKEKRPWPRRILVFVRSRSAATSLVDALAKLFDQETDLPSVGDGDPWQHGRFADPAAAHVPEMYDELRTLERQGMEYAAEFIRWLRTGVAAHSAQFLPYIRRQVEAEFLKPNGLLRVIVATDTLAIGMNLPADTVIATRITGYVGRGEEAILTPSEMDNKAGRAGRLGKTVRDHGTFYLITPPSEKVLERARPSQQDMERLLDPHEIFLEYIDTPGRGTEIKSHLNELESMARFVLIALCCRDQGRQPRARLRQRVQDLLLATLRAAEVDGDLDQLPRPDDIIGQLEGLSLLARVRRDDLELTGLGRAVGRAGLPLSMADCLQRIARLAEDDSDAIGLLYEAANTQYIHDTIKWVAMPPQAGDKLAELVDNLRDYAHIYAEPLAQRTQNDRYLNGRFTIARAAQRSPELLEATTVQPDTELSAVVDLDRGDIEDARADALLRAVTAFEWSRGERFKHIKARLKAVVSPRILLGTTPLEQRRNNQEKQRATLKLYISDVIQLCEQLSSVLAAAADTVDTARAPLAQVRLRALAASVGAGVPVSMVRIANLRVLTLHRERLLDIAGKSDPHDDSWEDIADLLRSPEHVSEQDLHRIRETYAAVLTGEGHEIRHLLYEDVFHLELPGGGEQMVTLGDWLAQLGDLDDPTRYRDAWRKLASDLGIDCTDGAEPGTSIWTAEDATVTIRFPEGRVLADEVTTTGGGIVVCWRGMSDRAEALVAEATPGSARFVEPRTVAQTIGMVLREVDEPAQPKAVVTHLAAGTLPGAGPPPWGDRPVPAPEQVDAETDRIEPTDSPE